MEQLKAAIKQRANMVAGINQKQRASKERLSVRSSVFSTRSKTIGGQNNPRFPTLDLDDFQITEYDLPRVIIYVFLYISYIPVYERKIIFNSIFTKIPATHEYGPLLETLQRILTAKDDDFINELKEEAVLAAINCEDEKLLIEVLLQEEELSDEKYKLNEAILTAILNKEMFGVIAEIFKLNLNVIGLQKIDFGIKKFEYENEIPSNSISFGDLIGFMIFNEFEEEKIDRLINYSRNLRHKDVINILLCEKKEQWAIKLIETSYQNFKHKDEFIATALCNRCFGFATFFVNNYPQQVGEAASYIFPAVNESIKLDILHVEIYLCFAKLCMSWMKFNDAKKFIEIISSLIVYNDTFFLLYSPNPIKICVLVIEIIRKIKQFSSLEVKCRRLEEQIIKVAVQIQSTIDEEDELYDIFFDRDLQNRELMTIVSDIKIIELFHHELMEKIVGDVWNGFYLFSGRIQDLSTSFRLLKNRITTSNNFELNERWNKKNKMQQIIKSNYFQYVAWRDGISMKIYVKSIMLMFNVIILQYFIYQTSLTSREVLNNSTALNVFGLDGSDVMKLEGSDDLLNALVNFKFYISIAFHFIDIYLALPLQYLVQHIFMKKTNRSYKLIDSGSVLDLGIFIVSMYRLCALQPFIYVINMQYNTDAEKYDRYLHYYNEINSLNVLYYLAFCMLLFWMKFLLVFRVNSFIGPLIKVVRKMLYNMSVFLVLYGIFLVAFTIIGNLLFYDNTSGKFDTFYITMQTLFGASFGQFDISWADGEVVREIFIYVFVLVITVMLLNTLIAILGETYKYFLNKSLHLYLAELASMKVYNQHDEKYGAMVAIEYPHSVILVHPFVPFMLLFPTWTERINVFLVKMYYTMFILIPIICLFALFNLALLPLAYLYVLVHKIVMFFKKNVISSFKSKISDMLIFMVFGVFILLHHVIVDHYYFVLCMYDENDAEKKTVNKDSNINFKTYISVVVHIKTLMQEHGSKMYYKEFINSIKEMLDIKNVSKKSGIYKKAESKAGAQSQKNVVQENILTPQPSRSPDQSRLSVSPSRLKGNFSNFYQKQINRVVPIVESATEQIDKNQTLYNSVLEFTSLVFYIKKYKYLDEEGNKIINLAALYSGSYNNILLASMRKKLIEKDVKYISKNLKNGKSLNIDQTKSVIALLPRLHTTKSPHRSSLIYTHKNEINKTSIVNNLKIQYSQLIFPNVSAIISEMETKGEKQRNMRRMIEVKSILEYVKDFIEYKWPQYKQLIAAPNGIMSPRQNREIRLARKKKLSQQKMKELKMTPYIKNIENGKVEPDELNNLINEMTMKDIDSLNVSSFTLAVPKINQNLTGTNNLRLDLATNTNQRVMDGSASNRSSKSYKSDVNNNRRSKGSKTAYNNRAKKQNGEKITLDNWKKAFYGDDKTISLKSVEKERNSSYRYDDDEIPKFNLDKSE